MYLMVVVVAAGADPLAVDMDPHHHQSSCVDDRPTYSQCGAIDRKQNGVARDRAGIVEEAEGSKHHLRQHVPLA